LAVNLVATTDKFVAGINAAQGKLGKFVSGISKATAIVGGFAAYGLASVVRESIAAADALGDMAANLNINVEAIQALDYATKQLGGSENSLHGALSRLNRLLGDAAAGNDTATAAFARLGLQTEELLRLPLEQQFLAIVDAINQLPTSAQQADAAQDIFGKGAKDLMSVIQSGSEAIRQMGAELANLGGILSQESVDALGQAENAIGSFTKQWEVFKTRMVSEFAPEIETGVYAMGQAVDFLAGTFKGLEVVGTAVFESMSRSLLLLTKLWNAVQPRWKEIGTQPIEQFIDSLKMRRGELLNDIRNWDNRGRSNPLAPASGQSKIETNTRDTVKESKRQTDVLIQMRDRLRGMTAGTNTVVISTGAVG
jgi:hypothetical protein